MAFCHNCGANVGDSLFCGNCGTKIPYNEKPEHNIANQSTEAESHEKEYRYISDPVVPIETDKEITEREENSYHSETQHADNPEPKNYDEPKTEIKNNPLRNANREYRDDPNNIYSNSGNYEPYRDNEYEEPYNKRFNVNENVNKNSHGKKKSSPKQHRKKVVTIVALIAFAVAAIGSAVAVGFYVKPKADLLVIANAAAKTVFQSGNFNYNIDEVYYEDGLDGEPFMGDNHNGCLFWGDNVKNSYFYAYSCDEEGYYRIFKYENGIMKVGYDGEEYESVQYDDFRTSNIVSKKDIESTTIDEKGFESLLDKAVIPFVNSEFSEYWESSLDSLTGEQTVKILTDMLSDEYFNENAVKINSKEKVEDGTKYSLTVNLNTLINSCWNYLKDSDIYRIMLDNSKNSEEFDREMTEFFSEFDYFDYLSYDRYYIDLIINNDGYISNLTFNEEEDYHHSVMQYRVEAYNFGIAEKQE